MTLETGDRVIWRRPSMLGGGDVPATVRQVDGRMVEILHHGRRFRVISDDLRSATEEDMQRLGIPGVIGD